MSEFKLISPQTLVGSDKIIDWKSCFLCQKTTEDPLQVPLNKPGMFLNYCLSFN